MTFECTEMNVRQIPHCTVQVSQNQTRVVLKILTNTTESVIHLDEFESCQNCIQTIRLSSINFLANLKKNTWHFIRHRKGKNDTKPANAIWTALVDWRLMESHTAVGCPLYCRFSQSPRFCGKKKNIFPSHKSQLMQHGWKTVISHDAFSFLTDLCGRVPLQGRERVAVHCRWRILLEAHALENERVLLKNVRSQEPITDFSRS